jgi:hypothetical protein
MRSRYWRAEASDKPVLILVRPSRTSSTAATRKPPFGKLGQEAPGDHLEVALAVARVERAQPGLKQRLVGFGAGHPS